jgi:hypothetical protein
MPKKLADAYGISEFFWGVFAFSGGAIKLTIIKATLSPARM